MKGSFTLEATFVVSICAWVLVSLCYGGLYIHDQVIMQTEVNTMTSRYIREDKSDLENHMKSSLDKKCFLFVINKVTAEGIINEKKVDVQYQIPLSFSLLKKLWMGNKKVLHMVTKREMITPALLMWDLTKEDESGKKSDSGGE